MEMLIQIVATALVWMAGLLAIWLVVTGRTEALGAWICEWVSRAWKGGRR